VLGIGFALFLPGWDIYVEVPWNPLTGVEPVTPRIRHGPPPASD